MAVTEAARSLSAARSATAMVVYSQPDLGMGIAFREVKSWFQAILEDWLRESLEKRGGAVD